MLNKILNVTKSIFSEEPLQVGLYKIPEMKSMIEKIHQNYDVIIFHLIRSTYYLPKNNKAKTILEMTDLISKNYETIEKSLSRLNPLKYLYKFEKKRINNYEIKETRKFKSVVVVNKKDLKNSKIINFKNIHIIGNGTYSRKNIFEEEKK